MALATIRPGRLRAALRRPRRRPLPAHDRAADARTADGRDGARPPAPRPPRALLAGRAALAGADARALRPQRGRGDRAEPVRPPPRDRAARPAAGARARDPVGRRPRALPSRRPRSASRSCSTRPGPGRTRTTPASSRRSRSLREERPELRLVLTGGGHEGRPVPPGVEVRGLVPGEELASLYRRTACLVFPSLYEGFGQPPLEAMASGAPVAASNIPAIAEVDRRRGRALRPRGRGGHRRGRLGRARRSRALRRGRASAGASASPGRRPPAGTRRLRRADVVAQRADRALVDPLRAQHGGALAARSARARLPRGTVVIRIGVSGVRRSIHCSETPSRRSSAYTRRRG